MKRWIKNVALVWILAVVAITGHAVWLVIPGTTLGRAYTNIQQARSGENAFFVVQRTDASKFRLGGRPIWLQNAIELLDAPSDSGLVTRTLVSESIEPPATIRFRDSNTAQSTTLAITWNTMYISWVNNGSAIKFQEGSGEFVGEPITDFERRWDMAVVRQFVLSRLTYAGLALVGAIALGVFLFALSVRFRKHNLCPKCNYDLRGNPEGVTGCGECGWGRPVGGHEGDSDATGIHVSE